MRARTTDKFETSDTFTADELKRDALNQAHILLSAREKIHHTAANRGVKIDIALLRREPWRKEYNGVRLEAILGGKDTVVYLRTVEEFPRVLAVVEPEEDRT